MLRQHNPVSEACVQTILLFSPGTRSWKGHNRFMRSWRDWKKGARAWTWALLYQSPFSKSVHHHLNGSPKQTRGQDRGIKEESLIPDKLSERCLSIATIAAMDRPKEQATCLVARSARSVVIHSSEVASGKVFEQIFLVSLQYCNSC